MTVRGGWLALALAALWTAACPKPARAGGPLDQLLVYSAPPESTKLVSVQSRVFARTRDENVSFHGARDEDYPSPPWDHAESVVFHFNATYHVPFYLGLAYATEPRVGDYNASQQLLSVIYGVEAYDDWGDRRRRISADAL